MHKNIIIPLICQCGLLIQHVSLKIQSCIMMWFFTSLDITWYAEVTIYAKNLFSLWNWQSVTNLNGVKNAIIKWHTFWMVPYLIYFFVTLFYIERKWLLMRNSVTILPLKSKFPEKFQRFNAIDRSIKMLKIVEFSKILSIKTENCKIFYRAQTASCLQEIIQSPPTPPLAR